MPRDGQGSNRIFFADFHLNRYLFDQTMHQRHANPSMRFCPFCGGAVQPSYNYCVHCGASLAAVASELSRREPGSGPATTRTPFQPERQRGIFADRPKATGANAPVANPIGWVSDLMDRMQGWPPSIDPPRFLSLERSVTIVNRRTNFSFGLAIEIFVIFALTVLAGWLRIEGLADPSPGINIDESTYAAEIHRIVDGEWVGKWSGASLGVPTLQFYLTAPLFILLDSELFAIRIVSALAGTLVVPVVYIFMRRLMPFTVSLVTTVLVAVSIYFMLESRIGWPIMLAILELLLGLTLLFISVERRIPWLAVIAGLVLGAGMYTHQVFLPYWASCIGLAIIIALFHPQMRHRRELYVFAATCLLIGFNMAWFLLFEFDFAADLENHYGVSASIDFVRWAGRAWEVLMFFRSPISADFTDAAPSGPILTGVFQAFFLIGLAVTVVRIKDPRYQLLLVGLLIGMSPSVIVPGSEARRYLVGMLFVFAFVGVGFNLLTQLLMANMSTIANTSNTKVVEITRRGAYIIAVTILIAVSTFSGYTRLDEWKSKDARWTFNYDLSQLTHFIKELNGSETVYLYSDRSGAPHPIIDWVAPHVDVVDGEEESIEGRRVLKIPEPRHGTIVVALLESYIDHATELREQYPDAQFVEARDEHDRALWTTLLIRDP